MAQKYATGLFVSANSLLMIKRELSATLHRNYSLLLQFEKSKESDNCEIILTAKKRGKPDFVEGKKFIEDYLNKQAKENLLNSVNPRKTKIKDNNNLSKPVVPSLSINENSKSSLTKSTEETRLNMKTSSSMLNKVEKTSITKISNCSVIDSTELSSCQASSDTTCDGKTSALPESKCVGSQKWRTPLVGWKQVTKNTSQDTVSEIKPQLTSDTDSSSKLPIPLVIDLKSSTANSKENINSKNEDECVVIVEKVEKQIEIPKSGTKRKYDQLVNQNTNKKYEDITNDSVIIIDDEPEDTPCKKRRCASFNDSVIIVEDTFSKHTRRRNKKSPVLGTRSMKGKQQKQFKSFSGENEGKELKNYESVLKKDFIPLSACASVVTYVNKDAAFAGGFQKRKKNDAAPADILPIYIDKGKNAFRSTAFEQSTSQNLAPQQQLQQSAPVGDNICSVKKITGKQTGLRPIVIDGSNVAMGHTNGRMFSCEGLKICIDYFLERKHKVIAFVPRFRQGKCTNADLLSMLEKRGLVTFTPSRRVNGKLLVSYDDRFIVQYAAECGGVIVSTDNFRDLLNENPNWKETIEKRLLMFTWAGDVLMFPHDPLGRGGPTLEELLRFPD